MPFVVDFNPIAVALGPLVIRWYALAYLAGFIGGWAYARYWVKHNIRMGVMRPTLEHIDDLLAYIILGVILGGRLGYVLFYQWDYFAQHPGDILKIWQGGMSFHGGALGVVITIFVYAYLQKINVRALGDIVCSVVPIGLFFGRLANFVNGELYGRISAVPWAMIFPNGGDLTRHPSQLYQAGLEGLALFIILFFIMRNPLLRARHGLTSGVFLVGYAIARMVGELYREPDDFIGFLWGDITMGQALSAPMIIAGLVLIMLALRQKPITTPARAP